MLVPSLAADWLVLKKNYYKFPLYYYQTYL